MERPLSLLVALLLSGAPLAQTAPTVKTLGTPPPANALYVGHSFFYFNNGLPTIVAHLLDGADPKNALRKYTLAGNQSGALVIPAGLAFAAAMSRNPSVEIYDPDKRHPSYAGSYLAACVVIATVYGKDPVGNPYRAGLEPKTAAFLQQVAADTVREYFGR